MHRPDAETFAEAARAYDYVPVYRRLLSDTLTPVVALAMLDDGGPACLFESVIGGEKVGRYSFLAVRPIARFTAGGGTHRTTRDGGADETGTDDPIAALRRSVAATVAPIEDLPPFVGGAIGYAAYDIVRYVENLPNPPPDDRNLPDVDFGFYHTIVVFDHVAKTIIVITLADCRDVGSDADIDAARRSAAAAVDITVGRLTSDAIRAAVAEDVDVDDDGEDPIRVESNLTRDQFEDIVRRGVEYIRAGDIFQFVPSQRLRVESDVEPLDVYRSLRVVNPSPYMFFLRTPDCTLIGCSPEILCKVEDRRVTVRPLAGTRRRGETPDEDRRLEEELLADPKERAEHVMLVDLGRNDVGRVAAYGSVELTEIMVVERYSHVMHISSEVVGTLRDDKDAFDAIASALPAGTVSGAPKIRAMEIIDEVEPTRRGPYGGAVGYLDYGGNMDTCIALRTIVHTPGRYDVQAGCGVVADSDPAAEYQETINKAMALVSAIRWTARRRLQSVGTSNDC